MTGPSAVSAWTRVGPEGGRALTGVHRGAKQGLRAGGKTLVIALVAIGLVALLVAGIDFAFAHNNGKGGTGAVVAAATSPVANTSSASPSPSLTASSPVSATPPSATPIATTASAVVAPPAATAAALVAQPVVVLNTSAIHGLAAYVAGVLHGAGYVIKLTGNARYALAKTTVFYDPGMQGQAEALVAAHLGVLAAAPRPAAFVDDHALLVVVTRTYTR